MPATSIIQVSPTTGFLSEEDDVITNVISQFEKTARDANVRYEIYNDFSDLIPHESRDVFEAKITDILENINKSIPESLQNCIIAGTKTALINKELIAKSLDDDEIMGDNRVVEYVRQELLQLGSNIINKFAVQLSDTINKILGDVENGNETED